MAMSMERVVTAEDRLEDAQKVIDQLKSQHRLMRKRLVQAYGAASSFKMLDHQSNDKAGEIIAAKETGEMLEGQLHDILFADNQSNKDY